MRRIVCQKHYDETTGFFSFTYSMEGDPDEPIGISRELIEEDSDIYKVDGINKLNIGQFRLTLIGQNPHDLDEYLYSLDK